MLLSARLPRVLSMKTILSLLLAATLAAQTPAPQVDPPKPAPVQTKKKSGKKKWIIVAAAVGGAVAVGLVAANKRFGNEGRPIF